MRSIFLTMLLWMKLIHMHNIYMILYPIIQGLVCSMLVMLQLCHILPWVEWWMSEVWIDYYAPSCLVRLQQKHSTLTLSSSSKCIFIAEHLITFELSISLDLLSNIWNYFSKLMIPNLKKLKKISPDSLWLLCRARYKLKENI